MANAAAVTMIKGSLTRNNKHNPKLVIKLERKLEESGKAKYLMAKF